MSRSPTHTSLARVVIVGAGFGGLEAAKALARAPFAVTVVDRRNYHLFQPLLYQVATAALSPADIAAPIRSILRGAENCTVQLAKVTDVDTKARTVMTDRCTIPYDYLILATGARHAYFGHDEWESFAPGLKKVEDATEVRRRILISFERAETEVDADERRRLLTFVVVGGGATGVEMAGAIAELAKKALAADFRNIDPRDARIVLVEAGPRLLPAFAPKLSDYAKKALESLGVEVLLGKAVTDAGPLGVLLGEERIESRAMIWAAGVRASPAGKWLDAETDRAGRVMVNPDLSVPGHSNVFVIGDAALAKDDKGTPLPGVATVAQQQGKYVARLLQSRARGKEPGPFRYRDPGSMATIGRSRAIAQIRGLKFTGFFAWVLWSFVHIYGLIGFRNRFVVALSWFWNYLTFERGTRLITGSDGAAPVAAAPSGGSEAARVRDAA
ncbi:MAG: NAD(P)/FAD-dependent oxidoreductase [Propylenella sp.]